jgi:AraC family transcriptional regulator
MMYVDLVSQELGLSESAVQETSRRRGQTATRWIASIQRALQHMQHNLDQSQSYVDIAKVAALSPYHFNRIFRRVVGIPPSQYLTALRLEAAKELVVGSEFSITDICYEVGYTSLGTFGSRFTSLVGVSPGVLRRLSRKLEYFDLLRILAERPPSAETKRQSPSIGGSVDVEADFCGGIFVALYNTLLSHANPVDCMLLTKPGRFRFAGVPANRRYFVMAAAIRADAGRDAYLSRGAALRAAHGPLYPGENEVLSTVDLKLRPVADVDPPILAALPAMMLRASASLAATADCGGSPRRPCRELSIIAARG